MTDLNYPDGGYGWIVLAGVCLVNMCTQSITSTFSLLFREHLENLDQQMYGAALLSSLNSIFLNFSGLITGPAIKIFKPRKVAIIGCLLVSIGLIISAISNKMWHMIVGYGVLVGIGLGLISPSNLMISHTYFMKKRSLVIGLSYCGTGIGQIILPLFIPLLLTKYGYFITVLITAAISLNGLLGASLFRPIKTQKINNNNKNNTNLLEQNNNNEIRLLINNDDGDRNNNNNNNNDKILSTELKNENEMKLSSLKLSSSSSPSPIKNKNNQMNRLRILIIESLKTISRAMDLELIKDLKFCNIIFGIGVAYTVSINFSVLFPYYLQSSAKLSSAQVSYCISILACSDTLFRLLLPTFTYKLNLSYRFIFLLGIIGLCINRFLLILFKNNLYLIYIITGLYGFSKSLTIVNNALAISQYIENNDKLSGALGLNMIMKGILSVILGQFLGWMKDYTDSYVTCFLMQNFLMCIVIILWCIEYLYKFVKYRRMKRLVHNVNNKIDDN